MTVPTRPKPPLERPNEDRQLVEVYCDLCGRLHGKNRVWACIERAERSAEAVRAWMFWRED